MAYNSKYLAKLVEGGVLRGAIWKYDTDDAAATVDTSGYISDALARGMAKGDLVWRTTWSALPTTNAAMLTPAATAPTISTAGWHVVMGITSGGAADLADTTALTVTNTD